MSFLAPMPAIVAAAVTVPALLLLYFLKLRRRPVRVGSTMLWQAAAEDLQANVPFRWLRPSLLLLLQLLILASLLLAMARPAIDADGRMPSRVFIIVDTSASMRATDMPDNQSRFEQAVALARRAVERVTAGGSGSEITLLASAASPEIVAGPTRAASEINRALDTLEATDQPGDLGAALRLVRALSSEEEDAGPAPLVVICSDGGDAGELPVTAARIAFERAAPLAPGENIGIVALAARRDRESPATVRVFARLESNAAETIPLGIAVRVDGEVVDRRAVEAAARTDSPGETPLAFEARMPGPGLLTLSIERDDALASDNTASVALPAPRRAAVLVIRESEAEAAGSGWLLTDVLRELDLSALTLLSTDRAAALGASAFEGYDLAIYDAVAPTNPPPIPSIHLGGRPALPGVTYEPSAAGVLPVLSWERSHPLLRDLSLDAVRVGRGHTLTGEAPAFTELARTAQGVVLAQVETNSLRRVISGFDLVQSTWPVDYSFALFLANAVESLPAGGPSGTAWSATTASAANPPSPLAQATTLTGPDGRTRQVTVTDSTPRIGVLPHAGVWRAPGIAVPVNLFESTETSLAAPESLPLPGGEAAPGTGIGGEPREIWPWFVLAAAVLLGIEWLVFGLRARI